MLKYAEIIISPMQLVIKQKTYNLPMFLPDATHASIKGLDSLSLAQTGIQGLVTNTYHLMVDEAVEIIEKTGGVKNFMNFQGLVITDSGGFQAMSLVRKNRKLGQFTEDGVKFKNPADGRNIYLTPESCIATQIRLGSDIIMVLDDCTDPSESLSEQEKSVERTVRWGQRCKTTYDQLTSNLHIDQKPLIFGIVQGGKNENLRKQCFEGLELIGFDGYAYGGWPMENKMLLLDILDFTARLMPPDKPKYAMGVGKPQDIIACAKMGYNMFDCVIPTRDARHGRLYLTSTRGTETINIGSQKYAEDFSPIDSNCQCYACVNYSKAYLRHLYKARESVYFKLASIHNLHCFAQVIETIK
jgi:queuine tRNA-ribosyltransferase